MYLWLCGSFCCFVCVCVYVCVCRVCDVLSILDVHTYTYSELVRRSVRLRDNAHFLPLPSFLMRKEYFCKVFKPPPKKKEQEEQKKTTTHLVSPPDEKVRRKNPRKKRPNAKKAKPNQSELSASPDFSPMTDPFAMISTMKQHLVVIIPNMLLMAWVSYFFSGFVLGNTPLHIWALLESEFLFVFCCVCRIVVVVLRACLPKIKN